MLSCLQDKPPTRREKHWLNQVKSTNSPLNFSHVARLSGSRLRELPRARFQEISIS